jgi:hypothetical protein
VIDLSRLHDQATAVGLSSDEAGCPRQETQCLLARTKPGGRHFTIDIKYDDSVGMRNPMQYRFGANKYVNLWATRPVGLSASINDPRRTTCSRCQLFHESSGTGTKI